MDWVLEGTGAPVVAYTAARVAVGFFFAASGYHKLFRPERHARLVQTLRDDHIPFIRFNQWWVPAWEFLGGIALMLGFVTVIMALALAVICVVATCTDGLKRVMQWDPCDACDWVDDVLYLPEVVYILLLALFITAGPGPWSVDAWLM